MRKGNQEQICVKLDQSSLAQLEMEYAVSGTPRNRIINRALIAYCQAVKMLRGEKSGQYTKEQSSNWFLNVLVPRIEHENCLKYNPGIKEG